MMMRQNRKELALVPLSELFAEFRENARDTLAKLSLVVDPESKEVRTYRVQPMPPLVRELFSALTLLNPYSSRFRGSLPYVYHSPSWIRFRSLSDHLYPSSSNLLLWSPLYKYLEGCLGRDEVTVRVRVSRLTIVRGVSHEDRVTRGIRSLQNGVSVIPDLRSLILLLDPSAHRSVFSCGSALDHPAIRYLCEGIYQADLGAVTMDEVVRGFHKVTGQSTPDLVMKIRLYVNRADYRAYYVDKNTVRHLVGSILQGVLGGPTARIRKTFAIEALYPAVGKNILQYEVTLPHSDRCLLAINGDISSFTNSCVNSWVVALVLLIQLLTHESVKHLNQPMVIEIRGHLVEATLSDVLWVYLVLTVGTLAQLASGATYIAPGGYLGVSFNNLSTMIAFCLLLEELTVKVPSLFPDCRIAFSQVGGDDFHLLVDAPSKQVAYDCWAYLTVQIETYVGHLKDPVTNVVDLRDHDAHVLSGEFCKKKLEVKVTPGVGTSVTVSVNSRMKFPLLSALLELEDVTKAKRKRLLERYDVMLTRFFDGYPESGFIRSEFLAALCKYQSIDMLRPVRSEQQLVPSSGLLRIDGLLVTRAAFQLIVAVRTVLSKKGNMFRSTFSSRAKFLSSIGRIQCSEVRVDDYELAPVRIYHTYPDQRWWSKRSCHYMPIYFSGPECLERVVDDTMEQLRHGINGLCF